MADPRRLLYTDFDGNALDTPAPLIGRGLVDDRHRERVPGLVAVVEDPAADPFDRLFACLALTAWGEEPGYRAVAAACSTPPPWHGLPADRIRAPFGLVAAQVGISDTMAERKHTEPARLDALRALIGVADREDFADQLGAAVFTGPPAAVAARRRPRSTSGSASPGPAPLAALRPAVPARRHPGAAGRGGRADRRRAGDRDRAARPEAPHVGLRRFPRRRRHHAGCRRAGRAHRGDRRCRDRRASGRSACPPQVTRSR